MKRILIFFGVIFLGIYGFGKFQDYQRYHSDLITYHSDKKINENHYDQQLILNYRNAIVELDSYVKLKWFTNKIDVLKPEEEDEETKNAISIYGKKLATVKFYEEKLIQSEVLKKQGLSAKEIQAVFENKLKPSELKAQKQKTLLKQLFNKSQPLKYGTKGDVVFEIQKLLVAKGYEIPIDGLNKKATFEAIKDFQEKNKLFPDGEIDVLTFEALR